MLHFFLPLCRAFITPAVPDIGNSHEVKIQFFIVIHKTGHVR
jgi:hypothetical protein